MGDWTNGRINEVAFNSEGVQLVGRTPRFREPGVGALADHLATTYDFCPPQLQQQYLALSSTSKPDIRG